MSNHIRVDHSALRTNQAFIIGLNLLAFIFDQWLVVLGVALVMLLGVGLRRPGFGFIYQYLLKPQGWVNPDVVENHPEPHRFAQMVGTIVLGISIMFFVFGSAVIGWAMVWLVVALATLNLFAGFCVGCAMYYWLARFHLPGFDKLPTQTPSGDSASGKAYE